MDPDSSGEEEGDHEEDVGDEVVFENDNAPAGSEDEGDEDIGDENMDADQLPPDESSIQYRTHTDAVYSVAFNPNNTAMIASGGGDDTAYIWDLSSSQTSPVFKLEGHTDTVSQVSFCPCDGRFLATAGLDAICKIWDPLTGKLLHSFEGPTESIECITWHAKGPILFAGGGDGIGWMWNASLGKVMNVFSGHSDAITRARFSPDGKKLITVSNDCTVRVWDPKTAQALQVIREGNSAIPFHDKPIVCLTCYPDPDSGTAISGGADGRVSIFNFNTGKLIASFSGHTQSVESLSLVTGLPCCVSGSLDKSIHVWDLNTQQIRSTMQHEDGIVKVLCIPEMPYMVFSCSVDNTLCIWDARTGGQVKKLQGHTDHVLDFDVINKTVISGGEDKCIRVWQLS